ncbi:MAG: PAS domain S-box protein, partial [Candidatus Bathyarchaeia archaeon]
MEHEIREKSERLQAFQESVSDPFVIWSDDLNLIEANSAFLSWFPPGTRKIDLFGKNIKELAPGAENRERYPVFLRVLETGEPAQLHNVPSLTGYGDRRYDVKVFKLGEGIGVLNNDITEHIEADEKLYESSLYARSLIEASLDPLVTISAEGKITDVNEATIQATGVPRGNLIGSDFSDYFTDPERARTGYKQVFSEGFVKDYPLTIRHASGKLTEVLYNATVYTNLVGEVTGVFAAARDVTEKNRLEKQLIRADRMDAVGKLTAMLAHDLRNPLNFIKQASDTALQEPERAKRLIQLIGENAERSLRMIEDLRSGTKEISLQRASTNLTQLIAKTAEEVKMPDGVEMEIATGEGVENVEVDAGLMRRVLDNLVTNAV